VDSEDRERDIKPDETVSKTTVKKTKFPLEGYRRIGLKKFVRDESVKFRKLKN
jgi:hypothetical protein